MHLNGRRGAGCAALVVVAALSGWQIGGCAGSLSPTVPINLDLGAEMGSFEAQAGVPVRHTEARIFTTQGYKVGRGSIELDPSDITVTPAASAGGKGAVNLQETSVLTVTVWVASQDELATVCESGEQYGPFEVTLDADFVPTAIAPSRVTLSANTIVLLNSEAFSLCIEVVSPINATVTIATLTFNLGL